MKLRIEKTKKIIVWPLCLILSAGLIFAGNGDILCVGEDGQMQVEPECLPSCRSAEDVCDLDMPNHIHDEYDECTKCSDIILDDPLWSKRSRKINQAGSDKWLPASNLHDTTIPASTNNCRPQADRSLLTFEQNPPSVAIAITILRC